MARHHSRPAGNSNFRPARLATAGFLALTALASSGPVLAQAAADPAKGVPPGKTFKDCADVCPEMVVIPAGSGIMGSTHEEQTLQGVAPSFAEREGPQVTVTIAKPYAMSKTEITRGQYARFVADTKRDVPKQCAVYNKENDTWTGEFGNTWDNPGFAQTDDHPAVCISWTDATDYAAWMAKKTGKTYRLASEAEWEYAARGGAKTAYFWGDSVQPICEKANVMTSATIQAIGTPESWLDKLVCASDRSWSVPVGTFEPNAFGVHDMIGSVWEWISDCSSPTHEGAPLDGSPQTKGDCTKKMVKGGAFHSVPWLARPATRGTGQSGVNHPVAAGIRLVRVMD
jgi:formylglycine-generating enzyme